jgi:hypothetical protein
MNTQQEITHARLTDHRKNVWFNPKTSTRVGVLIKNRTAKTLFDAGERMPGGIPVLYVKKDQ